MSKKKVNFKKLVFKELNAEKDYALEGSIKDLYDNWLSTAFPTANPDTIKRHVSDWRSRMKKEYMQEEAKANLFTPTDKGIKRNVMIIGDTHIPAENEKALDMLIEAHAKYNITDVIHIGDIIDNHAMSYHESDADGLSAGDELKSVKETLQKWYKAFPNMIITEGNHGALPKRRLFSAGVPKAFMRSLNEVLEVPTWRFVENITIGKVFFSHGIGMDAKARAKALGMSCVAGHHHGKKYIEYVDHNHGTFAMQVGCLVDKNHYAMAYGKHFVMAMGSGVITDIENNPQPILLNL